jgi:hypothetical protein
VITTRNCDDYDQIRCSQGDIPQRRDLEELRYAEFDALVSQLADTRRTFGRGAGSRLRIYGRRLARCRAILPQRPRGDLTGPRHVAQARRRRGKSLGVLCAGAVQAQLKPANANCEVFEHEARIRRCFRTESEAGQDELSCPPPSCGELGRGGGLDVRAHKIVRPAERERPDLSKVVRRLSPACR